MVLLTVNSLSKKQRAGPAGGRGGTGEEWLILREERKERPAFLFVREPAWHSVWKSRAAGCSESPALAERGWELS